MAQINLEPAYKTALEEFSEKDPLEMARNSSCDYDSTDKKFTIKFAGRDYYVYYPGGEATAVEGDEVGKPVRILLLHYLARATEAQVQHKSISFKELPGGMIYVTPFTNRAIRPLVGIFGNMPGKLVEAGEKMGGYRADIGDAAVTIYVFPKIPVTFVIWEGDDEVAPAGNVLFDSSAPFHMHTEDYAWIPGMVISEMKKYI